MRTHNKNHNYMLIELCHNVKGGCQMMLMSWLGPGTLTYVVEGVIATKVFYQFV